MKKSMLLQIFSAAILLSVSHAIAINSAAINPYTQVVFVSNSIAWPYNQATYGNDTFKLGGTDNADTQLLQSAQQGFHFPTNFGFGVACSAYQYEGNRVAPNANLPDGIGWSIWDVFSQKYSWLNPNGTNISEIKPTSNYTKPSGEYAIQGYFPEYYQQDLDLAKNLGVHYYRLSISWPRLFPHAGMTTPDPQGVKYYQNILRELQKRKIKVLITLYHWDMPAWLYTFGATATKTPTRYGWLDSHEAKNNETLQEFQKYVAASYQAFGKYTPYFSTFNEPLTFTNVAFTDGGHAPGQYGWELLQKTNPELYGHTKEEYLQRVPYIQAINLIKAHYIAYKTIHALYEQHKKQFSEAPQVSIVLNSDWAEPYRIECDATQKNCHYHADDIQASKNNMDFMLGWWLHPVMFGTWPDSMQAIYSTRIQKIGLDATRDNSCLSDNGVPIACDAKHTETLADYIQQGGALDLLAINHYTGYFAVDMNYASTHFSANPQENAVPPDQYQNTPTTLKAGWYSDQNAFITQFRYRKLGASGENPADQRVFVIGSAGNRPWLRQSWFVYHKLLQYINYYYLQQHGLTKMGVPFSQLGIYLTENGTSIQNESQNQTLHDTNRIQYLLGNLAAVQQSLDEGINIKLYTYWSIADNFEWAEGYDSRFGLVWIDYANHFARNPKDSYYCYQAVIQSKIPLFKHCQIIYNAR